MPEDQDHIVSLIKTYTDYCQRMTIANECGITTRQQIWNVVTGRSSNITLLTKLIARAKENEALINGAIQPR